MARDVGAGRAERVVSGGVSGGPQARYLPIAEHGLIGDLHTVALVGTDGTIDWYCCPRFDSPSVFAAILDADDGGSFRISPDCDAKQGKYHGGVRCYGYAKDGTTVIADEAAEIASACKAIARGASLREIVRDMNARKVPTATGKVGGWTSQQLRLMLMSPRIAGYSTHKGVIVGTAAWPAIVDDATWRTVEAILSNPARRTNTGITGAAKWLGSGTYICGGCGERALRVGISGGANRRTYRCASRHRQSSTGRHVTREAAHLDDYVERLIVARLSRPGTVEKLLHRDDTADVAALRVEQIQLGERKDQAAALFANGEIDAVQLATITKTADGRAAEIAGVLAKAGWRSPLEPLAGGNVEALWGQLSLAQKRAVLATICDVTVLPTAATRNRRGFDPDSVRIDWKVS